MAPPRACRVVTPSWLVYAQVGFTFVAGVTAVVLAAKKVWIPAFVLFAAATLTGVHADVVLRIWLATGKCNDKLVRGMFLFDETFTALVILAWLGFCIWSTLQQRSTAPDKN